MDAFKRNYLYVMNYLASPPWRLFIVFLFAFICNAAFIVVVGVEQTYELDRGTPPWMVDAWSMEIMRLFSFINSASSLMLLSSIIRKWGDLFLWQKVAAIFSFSLFSLPSVPPILTGGEGVFIISVERT